MSNAVPFLPECLLPTPSVTDTSQSNDTTTQLKSMSNDPEANSDQNPTLLDGALATRSSCREYLSAEEDSLEESMKDIRDSPFDELVRSQKEVYDLSTLIAWQKEEESRITRQSSLTRQRPSSSLSVTICLIEESSMIAASPFCMSEKPSTNQEESVLSPFEKMPPVFDENLASNLTGDDSGYIMVPNSVETEKVSLKTRIMWKLKKLRKRQTTKKTDGKK
eukprot:g1381.t1